MLHGKKVTLKPFTREMYSKYYQWCLDDEVMYYAFGEPYMYSVIPEEAFMQGYDSGVLGSKSNEGGMLGILTETDELIGEIDYREVDLLRGTAVLGIMIGEKQFWGKGYGTDAVRTMCHFLFQRFGLRRIQLDTWYGHERAVQAYTKVGFQIEGRLRKAGIVRGVPTDQIIMGLLREDFKVT